MPRYSLYSCSSIRSSTSTIATMNQPMARSQKLGLQPVTGSAQYICAALVVAVVVQAGLRVPHVLA